MRGLRAPPARADPETAMSTAAALDVDFCRRAFAPLANGWIYLDNAGGSYVPEQVVEAMSAFMRECQCQPAWPFPASVSAAGRLRKAREGMASLLNADAGEVVIGPSTTLNVYVLAHALAPTLAAGDEIVVTDQDHEANRGAWRRLAERGVTVREWRLDPGTGDLDPADLDDLLGPRTRLVCFPHVSNIVGSVNDVAGITARAHAAGAMVCVDGVAAVAHGVPDVKALDVDFYLFSAYKLYGPHLAVLYGKRERIAAASNQNHFFHEGHPPENLNPGGLAYESVAALGGVLDYLDAVHDHHFETPENSLRARAVRVFERFRDHEAALMRTFVEYLEGRPELGLVGRRSADPERRAPTFSLRIPGHDPAAVAERLTAHRICAAHGHFYGYRCVEALGIDPARGVLRLSMVHYNTVEEIERLVSALDEVL